jgi:hypothetical protein
MRQQQLAAAPKAAEAATGHSSVAALVVAAVGISHPADVAVLLHRRVNFLYFLLLMLLILLTCI